MKRSLKPAITPLEDRTVMTAGLKGTLPALGPPALASGAQVYTLHFFVEPGKLGKVKVYGVGFILAGDPSAHPGYDYIQLGNKPRVGSGTSLTLNAITAPVSSGSPSGPVTLSMQITKATGAFSRDLGAVLNVSIRENGHFRQVRASKLSISITPV